MVRTQYASSASTLRAKDARAELTKKQKSRVKDWAEELYTLGNEFPVGVAGARDCAAGVDARNGRDRCRPRAGDVFQQQGRG